MTAVVKPLDLSTLPCVNLRGVGERIALKLARLNIATVQDLLFHLPHRYQDRTEITPKNRLQVGEPAVIEGTIAAISFPKGGRTRLLCKVMDATGFIFLRFFHLTVFQRQKLQEGARIRCFGEVRLGSQGLEMIHPEYQIIDPLNPPVIDKTLTPIYPATEGVSQLMLRKLTDQALLFLEKHAVQEILPSSLLEKLSFPTLKEALQFVHRPPVGSSMATLTEKTHPYQKRLVFEELLAHRLSLLKLKHHFQGFRARALPKKNQLIDLFLKQLPFQLTAAQARVVKDIQCDLEKTHPMLRLVQGDVGSGKTVVAAMAVLQTVENNQQSALLAPTEILAEQHYHTFLKWFSPLNVKVVFLSGQLKAAEKKKVLADIQSGEAKVIIGTHAVFQKEVAFDRLSLMVVDEQHRFGVHQRATLREKGFKEGCYPHQLIMTATPIPRTLAMSIYADLDCSVIDELPPGRTPVVTSVIANTRRAEVLTRIQEACQMGKQVYWVCTLIEESELLQCQAAEQTKTQLSLFLKVKIGLIHGRMKPQEKEKIMAAFKKGEIQLLVATTVIEVGVDVPNASLMIIENAERLGLAQLHQLRGRVGRGREASYCVLLYQAPLSMMAKERLAVMRDTTDGFKIAERDLALRGPGEVLGVQQTGAINLRIADLLRDSDLLKWVEEASTLLTCQYPQAIPLLIKRWLGNKEQYGHV